MAISCLLLKQISSERRPLFCQPLYAIWRNCPNSMILMDQKESAEENKEADEKRKEEVELKNKAESYINIQ